MVARTQGKQTPTEYRVCTPHTLNPSTRLSTPLLGTPRATAGRKPPSCQAHIISLGLATMPRKPHFTDVETEAQRGQVTFQDHTADQSQSWGLDLDLPDPFPPTQSKQAGPGRLGSGCSVRSEQRGYS